jgi:hypothetical protein
MELRQLKKDEDEKVQTKNNLRDILLMTIRILSPDTGIRYSIKAMYTVPSTALAFLPRPRVV